MNTVLAAACLLHSIASAEPARPTRILVLPFDIAGFDGRLADDLAQSAAAELGKTRGVRATLRADLGAALEYQAQRALAGCQGEAACIADVGSMLEADKLVTGRASRIGNRAFVAVTLIQVARVEVEGRLVEETSDVTELPSVVRRLAHSLVDRAPAERSVALPVVDAVLPTASDKPGIVLQASGIAVMGSPCVEMLPSGRIPGDTPGAGLVVPLFGCILRDRHRLGAEPLVAADGTIPAGLLLRVLYTLGRAEVAHVRLAVGLPGGAQAAVRMTLPPTRIVGCSEQWTPPAAPKEDLPVSVVVADEGIYVGAPGAVLPNQKKKGAPGPTLPVLASGRLDIEGLSSLLGQVRKAWPRSHFVVSPSSRLTWADWAQVLATTASFNADVLAGTGLARATGDGGSGARALVKVITSRPPQADADAEPEFAPAAVLRNASGFTLQKKD